MSINARPLENAATTSLALIALLSGLLIGAPSSQARMRCVTGGQTISSLAEQRSRTSVALAHYKNDIVPCADDDRDRPASDSKASVDPAKDVALMVTWIAEKTAWAIREAPPIRFVPYADLVKIFGGGKPTDFHVEGLYSDEDHIIYLSDAWHADDLHDRSVLLHELVHHLQYLNHMKATCASEYEWQAVELQVAWLREQGVEDPLSLMGVSRLFLYMLRQCE